MLPKILLLIDIYDKPNGQIHIYELLPGGGPSLSEKVNFELGETDMDELVDSLVENFPALYPV